MGSLLEAGFPRSGSYLVVKWGLPGAKWGYLVVRWDLARR